MGEITRLLNQVTEGQEDALERLLPMVYDELRSLARHHLRAERSGHTLTPTALVHEAFLKLVGQQDVSWQSRAHFFAVASIAMRRVLISYARRRLAQKRAQKTGDATVILGNGAEATPEDVIALDIALTRLSELSSRQAQVVELSFFGALTHREIAEVLGVSVSTVRRDWRVSRAWLSREMGRL